MGIILGGVYTLVFWTLKLVNFPNTIGAWADSLNLIYELRLPIALGSGMLLWSIASTIYALPKYSKLTVLAPAFGITLFFSLIRSLWLALFSLVLVSAVFLLRDALKRNWIAMRRRTLGLSLVILAFLGGFIQLQSTYSPENSQIELPASAVSQPALQVADSSTFGWRVVVWQGIIRNVDFPLPSLDPRTVSFAHSLDGSHSVYFDMLRYFGWLGMIAFLVVIVVAIVKTVRDGLLLPLLVATLIYGIFWEWALWCWIIFGACLGSARLRTATEYFRDYPLQPGRTP
jgi:hypothetical protein